MDPKLSTVASMIEEFWVRGEPILVSTQKLLISIHQVITTGGDEETELNTFMPPNPKKNRAIISCDASIKKNPGGPSAVGIVINYNKNKPIELKRPVAATTSNQAEYDAIYVGLTQFFDVFNNPQCTVEVRSDSKIAVSQLNGTMKCNDPELERRRDIILELVNKLPVEVKFVWRPRNSTPELEQANYLAQDVLNVPRH